MARYHRAHARLVAGEWANRRASLSRRRLQRVGCDAGTLLRLLTGQPNPWQGSSQLRAFTATVGTPAHPRQALATRRLPGLAQLSEAPRWLNIRHEPCS